MSPVEVEDLVRWILGAWPVQAVKVDRYAMTMAYGAALVDLDAKQAQAAVVELTKTEEEWIPSPAKIRARVVTMNHGERRSGIEAWCDVVRLGTSARAGDVAASVCDPVTAACMDRLGMIRRYLVVSSGIDTTRWYVARDPEDEVSDRARFCELYDQISGQQRKSVQLSPGAKVLSPPRSGEARPIGGLVTGLLTTAKTEGRDDE